MSAFQNYFVDTIKNRYAKFDGRASRSEYWFFQLFNIAISLALAALGALLGTISETLAFIPLILMFIVGLGLIVPGIALAIRRMHDSDKSGWLLLCGFIPFVGSIILLVFMCLDSTPGTNQFGPNPYDDNAISSSQNFDDIIDR